MTYLLMTVYILCSASGLTLIRMGLSQGTMIGLSQRVLQLNISLLLIGGLVLYAASFILSLLVMSKMSLSVFYPISAGLVFVAVCLFSVFVLKESLDFHKIIGIGLILLGVVAMNLRKP